MSKMVVVKSVARVVVRQQRAVDAPTQNRRTTNDSLTRDTTAHHADESIPTPSF